MRLRCPKSAKGQGCKFKLQVLASRPTKGKKGKRRKPKLESARAKAKLKAGHSAIVSLKPRKPFAAKFAVAKKVLVTEIVTEKGATRTSYRRLKIVQ